MPPDGIEQHRPRAWREDDGLDGLRDKFGNSSAESIAVDPLSGSDTAAAPGLAREDTQHRRKGLTALARREQPAKRPAPAVCPATDCRPCRAHGAEAAVPCPASCLRGHCDRRYGLHDFRAVLGCHQIRTRVRRHRKLHEHGVEERHERGNDADLWGVKCGEHPCACCADRCACLPYRTKPPCRKRIKSSTKLVACPLRRLWPRGGGHGRVPQIRITVMRPTGANQRSIIDRRSEVKSPPRVQTSVARSLHFQGLPQQLRSVILTYRLSATSKFIGQISWNFQTLSPPVLP